MLIPQTQQVSFFFFFPSIAIVHEHYFLDVAYTRAWPTSTPEAAMALAVAAQTHQVNPLPGYDQNGVLLEPHYYGKRLDGATVVIRFELFHYLIRKGKDKHGIDTFSARVVQLRIILPPPGACPATPWKKKVLPHDTYFGSFTPTKRGRDDDDEKENEPLAKVIRYACAVVCYFVNTN